MNTEHNPDAQSSSLLRDEVVSAGKHSLIYVVGQAMSRAVGFFMIPVYTRFIAPGNYGAMEIIEILGAVVMMMMAMGVTDGMSRFFYAEQDTERRNGVVSTIVLGFGVLGIPVVLLFLALSGPLSTIVLEDSAFRFPLQVVIVTVWFGMLCEVGYSYLRMLYMAKWFVVVTTVQLVIALSLNIVFIVYMGLGILGIFYSTLISQSLTAVTLVTFILWRTGLRFSRRTFVDAVRFGLPLVPSRIGLMLGFVSNRFVLRWFGAADPATALTLVGLFSLGHKFGVVINRFVNAPFASFWSPRRLELLLGDPESAKPVLARVCTYATMMSVYAALLISAGIEPLLEIMADPSYRGAHTVVPFVALSYVALGLENHFNAAILYRKKTAYTTYITMLSLAIVVGWNLAFVPRFGLLGAASSNLAGFAVRVTMIYAVSRRLLAIPYEVGRIALMLGCAGFLYAVTTFVNFPSALPTFAARIGLAALFPLALYPLRFYHEGELRELASLRRFLPGLRSRIRGGGSAGD